MRERAPWDPERFPPAGPQATQRTPAERRKTIHEASIRILKRLAEALTDATEPGASDPETRRLTRPSEIPDRCASSTHRPRAQESVSRPTPALDLTFAVPTSTAPSLPGGRGPAEVTLEGADLREANLQSAHLFKVNLDRALSPGRTFRNASLVEDVRWNARTSAERTSRRPQRSDPPRRLPARSEARRRRTLRGGGPPSRRHLESRFFNNAIYDGESEVAEGFDYRDAGARFLPRTEPRTRAWIARERVR